MQLHPKNVRLESCRKEGLNSRFVELEGFETGIMNILKVHRWERTRCHTCCACLLFSWRILREEGGVVRRRMEKEDYFQLVVPDNIVTHKVSHTHTCTHLHIKSIINPYKQRQS